VPRRSLGISPSTINRIIFVSKTKTFLFQSKTYFWFQFPGICFWFQYPGIYNRARGKVNFVAAAPVSTSGNIKLRRPLQESTFAVTASSTVAKAKSDSAALASFTTIMGDHHLHQPRPAQ
jgi:hypothetical protein